MSNSLDSSSVLLSPNCEPVCSGRCTDESWHSTDATFGNLRESRPARVVTLCLRRWTLLPTSNRGLRIVRACHLNSPRLGEIGNSSARSDGSSRHERAVERLVLSEQWDRR